jgi:hypothetical protein
MAKQTKTPTTNKGAQATPPAPAEQGNGASNGGDHANKRTECPITADQFESCAKPITLDVNGTKVKVPLKMFSTGSFGWYESKKLDITVQVGDEEDETLDLKVQFQCQFIIVNSKYAPRS